MVLVCRSGRCIHATALWNKSFYLRSALPLSLWVFKPYFFDSSCRLREQANSLSLISIFLLFYHYSVSPATLEILPTPKPFTFPSISSNCPVGICTQISAALHSNHNTTSNPISSSFATGALTFSPRAQQFVISSKIHVCS